MRSSFKQVVLVLSALGIVFGVLIGCSSPKTDTSESAEPVAATATADDTTTSQDTSTVDSTAPEPAAAKDPTTAQDPVANTEPAGKVESLLSGETLARYRELPEEYRVALEAYSAFGVSDDLIPTVVAEKIAQWPDSPEPIQDLLDAERYAQFQELTAIHPNAKIGDKPRVHRHAFFFLGYYPYVLQTEDTMEGRKQAFADLMDANTHKFELGKKPSVPEQRLEGLIVPSALTALDALGPQLRDAIAVPQPNFSIQIDALAVDIVTTEVMLLKSKPGLEVPTITDYLSADAQGQFNDMPADMRENAERRYARGVLFRMIGLATSAEHPTTTLPSKEVLAEVAQHEFEFAQMLARQQEKNDN